MPKERRDHLGLRDKTKNKTLNVVPLSENSLPEEPTIPEPHRTLLTVGGEAGPGRQLWDRLWTAGSRWLKPDDAELILLLCEQEDERAILRRMVFQDPNDWRARVGLRQLERHITDLLSILGFTPTDRARIGFRSAENDPLADFRKRVEDQRRKA
jgi:hypothetical protein